MLRWVLHTVRGQIIAIATGTLLVTLGVIAMSLTLLRPAMPPRPPGGWSETLQIKTVIEALHAASSSEQQRIADALSSDDLHVWVKAPAPCEPAELTRGAKVERQTLTDLLGDRFGTIAVSQCASPTGTGSATRVQVPLASATLTIETSRRGGWPQIVILTMPLIVLVSFVLALVIALSVWSIWWINRPLQTLAKTVERFGREVLISPLEVSGSIEIRQVAEAFNRMQERISRSIEERKRMLMAVGHDLRTPLTRLKLRVEMSRWDRRELLRDLGLMQKMVDEALSFLNDQNDREPYEIVDIGVLVESVCVEFAETGNDVTYTGLYGWECRCQPTAITRAVSNVIENGCRYGTQVVADIWREEHSAVVEIRDNGPGISAAMRDIALLPFARLDPARAAEGRLGLGLSIVQDVVRRHGGTLRLSSADPSGLVVRIVLPIEAMTEIGADADVESSHLPDMHAVPEVPRPQSRHTAQRSDRGLHRGDDAHHKDYAG
jgi:signal transduction histidine kinase